MEQWGKPPDLAPGFTLAYRIVTPAASVNIDRTGNEPPGLVCVPPPPGDKGVEVDIVITAPHVHTSSWPGHRSMNTGLVGRFDLDSGHTVWAVHRVTDVPPLNATFNRGRYFGKHTKADLKGPGLRALLCGAEPDGSRVMYDMVLNAG
jgi:hypothetical protein